MKCACVRAHARVNNENSAHYRNLLDTSISKKIMIEKPLPKLECTFNTYRYSQKIKLWPSDNVKRLFGYL